MMKYSNEYQDNKQQMNMNLKMKCLSMFMILIIIIPNVKAYKNYTVGDSLGWYDKLLKPNVDYDKWILGKSFSLGDFLIFNTDNNHTVTQTIDIKTYKACDNQGDDNIQWSLLNPNSTTVQSTTIAVPLLKEGPTYFFSGDYDGEQCEHGQKFAINVTHGNGLPNSLKDDSGLALAPAPGDSSPAPADADGGGDDQSAPDTLVPANFNHPKNVPSTNDDDNDDDTTKKTNSASFLLSRGGFLINLIGGVLGFILIC